MRRIYSDTDQMAAIIQTMVQDALDHFVKDGVIVMVGLDRVVVLSMHTGSMWIYE